MKVSSIMKNPVTQKVTNTIKTPMRKAVAGAMMMTAVLGGTAVANAKTTNNDRVINQTEVVSIEGAKALASQNIQLQDIYGGYFDSKRLDALYLSIFAKTPSERATMKNEIKNIRSQYGNYLTAMFLEVSMFDKLLNEDVLKSDSAFDKYYNLAKQNNASRLSAYDKNSYKQTAQELSQNIDQLNEYFLTTIAELFQNGKTSFEDCSKKLDEIMLVQANAFPEEKASILNNYNEKIKQFEKSFSGSNNGKEEIIAYKTFLIYKEFASNRIIYSKLRRMYDGMDLLETIDPLNSQKHINTIVRYIVHIEDEKGIY